MLPPFAPPLQLPVTNSRYCAPRGSSARFDNQSVYRSPLFARRGAGNRGTKMKRLSLLAAAFATLLSLFAFSAPAEAHGRIRGGVYLNFGVPWPGWWAPRYYYPPPTVYYYDDYYIPPPGVVVERRSPPEYVERSDFEDTAPPPAQQKQNWWYWCPASEKYYPYVKECAGGFQRVPAQPVPGR
jgi:hypothetical protein